MNRISFKALRTDRLFLELGLPFLCMAFHLKDLMGVRFRIFKQKSMLQFTKASCCAVIDFGH